MAGRRGIIDDFPLGDIQVFDFGIGNASPVIESITLDAKIQDVGDDLAIGSIDLANTNINFFKTELNKAIAEQDLFLTKKELLKK